MSEKIDYAKRFYIEETRRNLKAGGFVLGAAFGLLLIIFFAVWFNSSRVIDLAILFGVLLFYLLDRIFAKGYELKKELKELNKL